MRKDINGFEGLYAADSHGDIISLRTGKSLAQGVINSGYKIVHLYKDGNRTAKTVHRLIARCFIDNPENKEYVNHIDGNKHNNDVSNLSWSTPVENSRHAHDTGLMDSAIPSRRINGLALGKKYGSTNIKKCLAINELKRLPVEQLDLNGIPIKVWPSKKAARSAGFHNISKVLSGEYSQSGGYKWRLYIPDPMPLFQNETI